MIAYATAGAFLGMAYFDYFYNLVLIVIVGKATLARHLAERPLIGRLDGNVKVPGGVREFPSPQAVR